MVPTIIEAKKLLQQRYRHEEGFVGVGLGRVGNEDALRVYVTDTHVPLAQQFIRAKRFEGFPIVVEVSGEVQAFTQ